MIYDVFLSYSARDGDLAQKLESALKAHQVSCYLAPKGIRPGQDFAEEIKLALIDCPVICLLATPNSLASEWVTTEWGAAWVLGKAVIPVLLRCRAEDLPDRLRRLQCVDFHDVDALIGAIRDLGRPSTQFIPELGTLNLQTVCS